MSEDRVLRALKMLREADAEREASPEVEARLVRAFRVRKRRVWRWAAVGIAAGLIGLAALAVEMERPVQRQVAVAEPVVAAPFVNAVATPIASAPAKPRAVRRKPVPELREVVTEFFPLMDTPPPFERGELVRVSLPASALRRAGFVVEGSGPDDPIEADVFIGEEGLARAIRFVSYQ